MFGRIIQSKNYYDINHQSRFTRIIMLHKIIAFISLFALLPIITCKLHQVVSMFRHGARYHLNSYYDGNATKQLWGELTSVGMRQHQTLGRQLRRDYITNQQFLSSFYKPGEIDVITTNVNRTFQSARSQLYGLYGLGLGETLIDVNQSYRIPPYSNKTDNPEKVFALPKGLRTIAININDKVVMTDCGNWNSQVAKNVNRQPQIYNEMVLTYNPFLRRMGDVFNITFSNMNFSRISSLYDTLTVDKYLGRPMPEHNFTDDDYYNMKHLHYWYNFFKISFNLSRAINTGKINRILADFDDRVNNLNNKTLKWTFLSAHDTDASGMLLDLNMSSAQCIQELYRRGQTSALNCSPDQEYATSLIFELHSDDGKQFYVKIRHDGKYLYLCERKEVTCPYEQWKSRVKKILIDESSVCDSPTQPFKTNKALHRLQTSVE